MTDTALTTTEPVLFETDGGHFKGKLRMYGGRFELTARQLIFYQRSYWFQMFGLIGALLGMKSKGKRALEIELRQIRGLARGKFGLNKKILDVTLADGSEVRLSIAKYDELTARLREQISLHAQLVDAGEERWQIVAA